MARLGHWMKVIAKALLHEGQEVPSSIKSHSACSLTTCWTAVRAVLLRGLA